MGEQGLEETLKCRSKGKFEITRTRPAQFANAQRIFND